MGCVTFHHNEQEATRVFKMKKDYHKKRYVEVKARTIQREIRWANVPAFNKQWWSKLSLFSLPNLQVFHCSLSSHHTKTKTQKTPSES